jgi:transcriptional regulator with XRE-family HTH domain
VFYTDFERVCREKDRTPSEVTAAIGMSKSNTTHWKNGASPKLKVVSKLATELGVPVAQLTKSSENAE